MLISEKKQFLFYHVYKVAGTSIRDVLRPYCSKKQVALQNLQYGASVLGVNLEVPPVYKFHPRLVDVRDYMGDDFYKYYRFSFVRHPFDWQKSLYFFMCQNKRHHQHDMISKLTFEEYIKWRIDNELHLMSDLVSDSEGEVLLNDVYKFENIQSEFSALSNKLNITGVLPHKNVAGKGKKVELSDSTMKEFREAFSADFKNFKYD